MSKDWTAKELQAASEAMKQSGNMGYEEFCESLRKTSNTAAHFDVKGATRKALVIALEEITGIEAVYQKAPTFAYTIGSITIDKEGNLITEDKVLAERVIYELAQRGFHPDDDNCLCIELPKESLPETAREKFDRILEAKGALIKKAVGADNLAYEVADETIHFPWFKASCDADENKAYMQLISALTEYARKSKRVTAKEKDVENEKYAFRCFLLRLGMIGDEFKTTRKILLRNLDGNPAWKNK